MVKIVAIFIFSGVLFFTSSSFAQVKVGVNGGVVLSSLVRDSNLSAQKGRVGYLVGINAKYNLGDLGWYVLSGVDYTLEGDSGQKLNFIKLPLTLGLGFSSGGSIFVAYNFAWQVGNDNGVQDFYKEYANILGMGFEIKVSEKISLCAKLNYGLSNLVEDPAQAKNYEIKPFTFGIYLTYYLFNSGK